MSPVTTGAVAAGGALGAKGGAVLGTVICPGLGTAIGGFLGGVAGAVVGTMTAGELKAIPLRDAVASYERQHAGATAALQAHAREIVQSARVAASTEQRAYDEHARRFRVEMTGLPSDDAVRAALAALLSAREAARADTRLVEARILGSLPRDPGWARYLGLVTANDAADLARRATNAARSRERALAPAGIDPPPPMPPPGSPLWRGPPRARRRSSPRGRRSTRQWGGRPAMSPIVPRSSRAPSPREPAASLPG